MIAVIIIILLILVYYKYKSNLTKVIAGVVNREWNVVGSYENNRDAAELLARVNSTMIEFMRFLRKKYHIDESGDVITEEGDIHSSVVNLSNDRYKIIDSLLNNYNPDAFYETDPKYTNNTSYTINKGTSTWICMRDKSNPNKLVHENDLLFVLLHECSHMANYNGWGHDEQFWIVFKFILYEAELSGIYKPVDYSKYPINYCGLDVQYNPLFDHTLKKLWE